MSDVAQALAVVGLVLAVFVQVAALVWVLVKVEGRPRLLAASGLGLLTASTVLQAAWSRVAVILSSSDDTIVALQTGWLVANVIGLVGLVLIVAGVAADRKRTPPYPPTWGVGPQHHPYGPENTPPAM